MVIDGAFNKDYGNCQNYEKGIKPINVQICHTLATIDTNKNGSVVLVYLLEIELVFFVINTQVHKYP